MTSPRPDSVLAEDRLVERLVAIGWKGSRGVLLGPGDDAAILRGGLVLSTDLAIEGVHFSREWINLEEAGFRAAAAALSDMAAMGAAPEALLVSMAAPADGGASMLEELQLGARRAGDRVGAAVVGGDVSRSPGPVVVDVAVAGRARRPLLRAGARAGDEVWVSGALGGAARAVTAWTGGASPNGAARARFAEPPNRVPLALRLARDGLASAAMDLSDGLLADARRLARASGVRLEIRAGSVPVDREAEASVRDALEGGEDYELMFTSSVDAGPRISQLGRELSVQLARIGTVGPGEGVALLDRHGASVASGGPGGWDHFAPPQPAPAAVPRERAGASAESAARGPGPGSLSESRAP